MGLDNVSIEKVGKEYWVRWTRSAPPSGRRKPESVCCVRVKEAMVIVRHLLLQMGKTEG